MKNLLEQQDDLKGYQDEALKQELQQPTGVAPSFLIMSELGRREDMRKKYQMEQAKETKLSMAEEMAAPPRQGMPTGQQAPRGGGIGNVPPPSPSGIQGYAGGGLVGYNRGGLMKYEHGGRVHSPYKTNLSSYGDMLRKRLGSPFSMASGWADDITEGAGVMSRVLGYDPQRSPEEQLPSEPNAGEAHSVSDIAVEPTAQQPAPISTSASISMPISTGDVFDRFNAADRPEMQRADTSQILDMFDSLEQTKANSKGAALLKMGASMMSNTGSFGQALGEGVAAGLTEYQSNEALNRDIDMARAKGMTQVEAIKAADSRAQYQGDVNILQSMISSDGSMRAAMARASKSAGVPQEELMKMIFKQYAENIDNQEYPVTNPKGKMDVMNEAFEEVLGVDLRLRGVARNSLKGNPDGTVVQ